MSSFALGTWCPDQSFLKHKDQCVSWIGKWAGVDVHALEKDWKRFELYVGKPWTIWKVFYVKISGCYMD